MPADSPAGHAPSDGNRDERAPLRAGLLDQLAHLVREVDMLESGPIARVPEKLMEEAPPGEARSIKEIFALTARLDEAVHPRRIECIQAEDAPRLAPPDPDALLDGEDWNAQPMSALFGRVRAARRALIDTLASLPPDAWLRTGQFPLEEAAHDPSVAGDGNAERDAGEEDGALAEQDLYWMAHAICQHDRTRLEAMTRRLYESHMGPAPGGPDAPPDARA